MPRSITFMVFRYRKWIFFNLKKDMFASRNFHRKGHFHLRSAALVYRNPTCLYVYVIIYFLFRGKT